MIQTKHSPLIERKIAPQYRIAETNKQIEIKKPVRTYKSLKSIFVFPTADR